MPVLVRSNRATDLTPNRRRGAAAAPEMHLSSCREPPSAAESGTSACEKKRPVGCFCQRQLRDNRDAGRRRGGCPLQTGRPGCFCCWCWWWALFCGARFCMAFAHPHFPPSRIRHLLIPAFFSSHALPCSALFSFMWCAGPRLATAENADFPGRVTVLSNESPSLTWLGPPLALGNKPQLPAKPCP